MSDDIGWERGSSGFDVVLLRYTVRKLLPLGHGSSVLDVGCNDGMFTKELCKQYERVTGIDPSNAHINKARVVAPTAEFRVATAETYAPAEAFDTIYALNVLEHVDDPIRFLTALKRWLKPDGVIIIQVPNALSLNRRVGTRMGIIDNCYELAPYDSEVGHRRFYDMGSLRRDVTDSGMVVEASGSIFLKLFSNQQMARVLPYLFGKSEMDRFCDACCGTADELPDYSSPIWVRCADNNGRRAAR